MAVTTWEADVQQFEAQFHGLFVDTIQENTEVFNAASRGGIRMVPRQHRGNFLEESLWTNTSGAVSRRDTESSSTATDLQITQDEDVRVKLSRTGGPFKWTEDTFAKIMQDPQRAAQRVVNEIVGPQDREDKLDRAFAAFIAAIENEGSNDFDATDGTIVTTDLIEGLNLMGDKRSRIVAWVMHSKVYNDLLKDQVSNGPTVENVAGHGVVEGTPVTLGRPVVLIDNDSLVSTDGVSSGVDEYHTLGLVPDGIRIHPSEDLRELTERRGGEDNIYWRFQSEWAYSLGIKGFKWDITNGGKNPTNANVATGSNWDTWAGDSKQFGGVLIRSR